MDRMAMIFWLGVKELRSLRQDRIIVALLIFAFTFSVYTRAQGTSAEVHNATVGIVDEDRSMLSRRIANALLAPYFHSPEIIGAHEVDAGMNSGRFMFVLEFPPRFEADVLAGRATEIQLQIDATAMTQASIGASYIQNYISDEVTRLLTGSIDRNDANAIQLVTRMAFNPNRTSVWFNAIVAIINQISMLTIVLVGAALIREREHGTIEHLLVMPLRAFDIAMAKVWANAMVILTAVTFSMVVVIEGVLEVPIAGSKVLFLAGTCLYLFFATAMGIFLGTIARSMAQFALLVLLVLMPMQMLSGGSTPIESQPDWLQAITFLLPSRHFVSLSQGIIFRGAGFSIVWPEFLTVALLGLIFFGLSLVLFRRSIAVAR